MHSLTVKASNTLTLSKRQNSQNNVCYYTWLERNGKSYSLDDFSYDLKGIKGDKLIKSITEFKRLFFKAVKNRLRCIGNIGAEVSGGLDSTGIAAVALEQMDDRTKMFTYSFGKTQEELAKNLHKDDNDVVEEMCVKYGVANNWLIMRDDSLDLQDIINLQLNVLDEPDNNGVPLLSSYFLKQAKNKNKKAIAIIIFFIKIEF